MSNLSYLAERALASAWRIVLGFMKARFEETSSLRDDQFYNHVRAGVIERGWVDDGGPDDPGPISVPDDEPGPTPEDGGGGGPG